MTDSQQTRGRPVNEQARLARRQMILAGARHCIVESGIHAASISEIAARSKVSTANIYQYFDNKDALIFALIRVAVEADLTLIRRVGQTGLRPVALREILAPFFQTEVGRTAAVLNCEFASEAARNPQVARMLEDNEAKSFKAISDAITAAQRDGLIPKDVQPDLAAEQFGLLFDGIASRLVRPGADGTALLDLLISHFIQLLKIPHP